MNQMAALIREEIVAAEKKKPFPVKKESAVESSLSENEIGLLDVVFLDAIFTQDAVRKR